MMTKYIDADALVMQMTKNVAKASYTRKAAENPVYSAFIHASLDLLTQEIEDAPAADVAPVVHGEWLLKHIGHGHYWECSVCHAPPNIYITENTKFCPNCGARMDEYDEH